MQAGLHFAGVKRVFPEHRAGLWIGFRFDPAETGSTGPPVAPRARKDLVIRFAGTRSGHVGFAGLKRSRSESAARPLGAFDVRTASALNSIVMPDG
jgi:hypothetical protein